MMVTCKLDIDFDDPFPLSQVLMGLANYQCAIRLSSTKGIHMKIFDVTPTQNFVLRNLLDDKYRFAIDEARTRTGLQSINILWDCKNGKHSSVWVLWNTRYFAQYLLMSSARSLRDAVSNLHTYSVLEEFGQGSFLIE